MGHCQSRKFRKTSEIKKEQFSKHASKSKVRPWAYFQDYTVYISNSTAISTVQVPKHVQLYISNSVHNNTNKTIGIKEGLQIIE